MAERMPCLRRCSTSKVASPNQKGVERTDWEEVWMITDPSAILFIGASLMEVVLFFLLKEAHFYLCSLQVSTSRCASRGLGDACSGQGNHRTRAYVRTGTTKELRDRLQAERLMATEFS